MPTGSTPTILWTTVLMLGPGALLGLSVGLRGWLLAGSAPALTLGFTSAMTLLFHRAGVGWGLAGYLIALTVTCLVAALLLRPWRCATWTPSRRWSLADHVTVAAAVAFTGVLGARVMTSGMGSLTTINQTWDAMFHANAIRFIATTGEADPNSLAPLISPHQSRVFYPDVFHAIGALVMRSTGDPAQAVMNAEAVPLALVFALSSVALARSVSPRPAVALWTALLAGMFASMPYDLIHFGSLFPFALATAAMPAVAALLTATLRRPTRNHAIALAVAASGVFATHPSVGVSTAALCVLTLAGYLLWPRTRGYLTRRTWIALGSAVAGAALLLSGDLAGLLGQTADASKVDWPKVSTPSAALGNLLFFGQGSADPQWVLAALFAVGLFTVHKYRASWPLLAFAAVAAGQFVLAAGYDGAISLRLTEFWWNDRWRFAALFIPGALIVSAFGVVRIVDALEPVTARIAARWTGARPTVRLASIVPATVVAVIVLLITGLGYHASNGQRVASPYHRSGPTVLPGETRAFAELKSLNTGNQTVMNDPLDGTGWAYTTQGIPLLFKVPMAMRANTEQVIGADAFTLLTRLNQLDTDPEVRAALTRLGVGWVLVGNGHVPPAPGHRIGLRNLQRVHSLKLVWQNSAASIYRVTTAADAGPPPVAGNR